MHHLHPASLIAFIVVRAQVLRLIDRRESKLTEAKQVLGSFQWHRGRDTDAEGLLAALVGLRNTSRDVVRGVMVRCVPLCPC